MTVGMSMDGIIANSKSDVQPCIQCKAVNVCLHMRTSKPVGRHFIINFSKSDTLAKIGSFSAYEPVEIFGVRWMLIAFAEYIPGHYRTMRKTLNCWICISDDNVTPTTVPLNEMDLSNYIVQSLVFLRLN